MQRITVRLPDNLLTALEARAAEEHRNVSNMVCRILSLDLGISETEDLDEATNPRLPLK